MIRLLAGAALIAFGDMGGLEVMVGYILMGVGAVLVLTSMFRFRPLYAIFGIKTCKCKKD